jgi:hypothetical protein
VSNREQLLIDALQRSVRNKGNRVVAKHVTAGTPRILSISHAPQMFLVVN